MNIDFTNESKEVRIDWSVEIEDEEYYGSVTFHDDYSRMEPTFSWDEAPDDGEVCEEIESEVVRTYYERKNNETQKRE